MIRYRWMMGRAREKMCDALRRVMRMMGRACMVVMILLALYVAYDADVVVHSADIGEELMQFAPNDEGFVFDEWKEINHDIVAWIKIEGTSIDYPVLQAEGNDYYLARNYRKEFATAGSIFLDYRDDVVRDVFLVIYGHRMSGGGMFTDVTKYADENYYDKHVRGELFLESGARELVAVGFAKIKNTNKIYASHEDVRLAIEEVKKNAIIWHEEAMNPSSKYVLLSTCDALDKTMRDVLLLNVL